MANSVIKYRLSGSEQTTYNVMKYHIQGSNYTHKDQDNEAVGCMFFSLIIQIDVSNTKFEPMVSYIRKIP